MQDSEPQPEDKISPEQADAFAAELAPGWANEEQRPDAEPAAAPDPIDAPPPPPVQQTVKTDAPPMQEPQIQPEPFAKASDAEDRQTPAAEQVRGPLSVPSSRAVALANEETEVSIQQPEPAATQPAATTPDQWTPEHPAHRREVVGRELRRAAAAPPTVQVRAPAHEEVPEAHVKSRLAVNLALIVLGIGVGIASVMVYLELRENRRPANTNQGFQTSDAPTDLEPTDLEPTDLEPTDLEPAQAVTQPVPIKPLVDNPLALEADAVRNETAAEVEIEEVTKPVQPQIMLRLKTTPPDATVTVNGDPFANPFEGEVAQGGEHLFVARAPGYEPEQLRVRFDSDRRVQMDLVPVERQPTTRARRGTRKASKRSVKPVTQAKPTRKKPATFVTDNPY